MAKWIWTGGAPSENEYVIARCTFTAGESAAPELLVSADSDFAAFLNGEFLGRGQFSDYPQAKTFTRIPLAHCRAGRNELEIRAYFCGGSFLTHIAGTPRLWAEVRDGSRVLAATGRDWEIADDPAFRRGKTEMVNIMLGYIWYYDARQTAPVFRPAVELDFDDVPTERPVPMLFPGEPLASTAVWYGYFKRREPDSIPGAAAATDMIVPICRQFGGTFPELPADADGWAAVYDLGRESTGLLTFDVEATEGTVLDIAHGEHLALGRVMCSAEDRKRTYTDRYTCRAGRNRFTYYFRRYGGRYLEMHVTGMTGPVTIHQLTLRPTEFVLEPAAFSSCDRLMEKTHAIGARTLVLCMHEHYEDCPWREQSLYGYDSRNQMLFGYYAFGNYKFAAASLDLLARSMRDDGFLTLTAPGWIKLFIPIFTFAWLAAMREYELYSGDRSVFERHREAIRRAVKKFTARPAEGGVYLPPVGDAECRTWNFCEWVPGLTGDLPHSEGDPDRDAPTAFYNLYLVEALRAVAALDHDDELRREADAIGARTEAYFWNAEAGCYATRRGDAQLHAHIQYLMLALGLVPEARKASVLAAAQSDRVAAPTFSSYIYMIRALAANGADEALDQKLRADFDRMTLQGATSFWEVAEGYRGFSNGYGGSLCHGWSCAGILFDGAYRLGVIPLEPGFKTFALEIHPCGEARLSGEVPTPHGPIRVAWRNAGTGGIEVKLEYPEGTRPARIASNIRLVE